MKLEFLADAAEGALKATAYLCLLIFVGNVLAALDQGPQQAILVTPPDTPSSVPAPVVSLENWYKTPARYLKVSRRITADGPECGWATEEMPLDERLVREEEGCLRRAYREQLGNWTVGIGHLLDHPLGRSLTNDQIERLFSADLELARVTARELVGDDVWATLSSARQAVLVSMAFQLGADKLSRWQRFLRDIETGQFRQAAADGRQNLWFRQTPERAERQLTMLVLNDWVPGRHHARRSG